MPQSLLASPAPFQVRDELAEMITRDLLGPAGGADEELDQREDHVYGRYLVGMLAPQPAGSSGQGSIFHEQENLNAGAADDADGGETDTSAPVSNTFFPTSCGLSCTVAAGTRELVVDASWGRYERVYSTTQKNRDGKPAMVWKRVRMAGSLALPLAEGTLAPRVVSPAAPQVVVEGRIRKLTDCWLVTLFLVNQQTEQSRRKDEAWVFQPGLAVHAADSAAVFVQRHSGKIDLSRLDPLSREETETLAMLYRHRREYAVGHGVSVHATLAAPHALRATAVETEYLPQHVLPQQTPRTLEDDPNLAGVVLDMQALATLPRDDLLRSLRCIESAYAAWIAKESAKCAAPKEGLEDHQAAAKRAVERAREACRRLGAGIGMIEAGANAEAAFRFANRAMALQRVHSIFAHKMHGKELAAGETIAAVDVAANRSWRLFQIAFVLINLPGLTDLGHPDRGTSVEATADLLWFATGGGKTEAYLGLTAYTLAIRRLQGTVEGRDGMHGVAVLMRYTLRLLTLQQFQRAAALMCACETIRREDETKWGTEPFRLGLWVGSKSTPNTLKGADEALNQYGGGRSVPRRGTPYQLTSCPWCGHDIRPEHVKTYLPPGDIGRCVTYCGDPLGQCAFSERAAPKEGLPVMVVDEGIYRRPPALLIATVDKFAQMPWKGETQMLFGKVDGRCPRHGFLSPEIDDNGAHNANNRQGLPRSAREAHGPLRPPDLIIQDELHLVSGPLGSIVGLYEAAVDLLCTWNVGGKAVRPKVVASTATIRRAEDQVLKLFARKLAVFPPQGTSVEDSFFAIERAIDANTPGRRYLGICAFGRRYPAALIRTYVACLAGAQTLYDKHGRVADPWMTATGYFNSIRELAGTRRLVEDDIRARLRDADQRGFSKRRVRAVEELTSRKSGVDIPKVLERLQAVFDPALLAQRERERKERGSSDIPLPYDVILATNMISVGVDIERLGLMVVGGQPKNTAEYIQATSRVGRSNSGPGLVCTLYNWARPRDLSHYEAFEHYHDSFYKHVEALSVTPFAPRALDRGLSGALVGMLRLGDERLNPNTGAGQLTDSEPLMKTAATVLAARVRDASHDQTAVDLMNAQVERRREEWLSRVRAQREHQLGYETDQGAVVGLLERPEPGRWPLFACLNSLRDVEGTVDLVLHSGRSGLLVQDDGAAT